MTQNLSQGFDNFKFFFCGYEFRPGLESVPGGDISNKYGLGQAHHDRSSPWLWEAGAGPRFTVAQATGKVTYGSASLSMVRMVDG